MGALPRPELPPGPHRDLVVALHDLHHRAGWPSLRTLAGRTGVSHTTVSHLLSSPRLPAWGMVELLVEALGGSPDDLHALWLAATTPEEDRPAEAPPQIAGRRAELAAVRRHLEAGTGLLVVAGEAGIGKTTLVDAAARSTGVVVTTAHCLPLATEISLLPVVDGLTMVHEVDDGRWLEEALEDLPAFVRRSVSRLLPQVGTEPREDDPGLARQRLFTSLGMTLSRLAELRPSAWVIEDLHWADRSTLDLLEHLLARPTGVRVVGTWRTEDPSTPAAAQDWLVRAHRSRSTTRVDLGPLSRADTVTQMELLGISDPERVSHVHGRSQGLPLFTEQLAAHLEDGPGLPRALADLLDSRLEGLDVPAWAVLRLLGVAERPLSGAQIAAAGSLAPADLTTQLHALRARRLIRSTSDGLVHLQHPLLAEAAQRRLLGDEAAQVHRDLARVFGAEPGASAAEVAQHWRGAGDTAQELGWRIAAARAAGSAFEWGQEADHWLRAIELWPEALPHAGEPPATRPEAYVAAMDALKESLAWDRAADMSDAAAQALGDVDSATRAELLRRAAEYRGEREGIAVGMQLIDESLALFELLEPSTGYVHALSFKRGQLMEFGRYDEARVLAERTVRTAVQVGDRRLHRHVLSSLAWHEGLTGSTERASALLAEAAALVRDDSDPVGDIRSAILATDVMLVCGSPLAEVERAALPALELAQRWGIDNEARMILAANLAHAILRAGRVTPAEAVLGTTGPPDPDRWPLDCVQALVECRRGDLAAATARIGVAVQVGPEDEIDLETLCAAADVHFWGGEVLTSLPRLLRELDVVVDSAPVRAVLPGLVAAARGAAALASDAPAEHAHTLVRARALLHRGTARVAADDADVPQVVAHLVTAQAEVARATDHDVVDGWAEAARAWDGLGRPHDAAYCHWRAAQRAFRDGRGVTAARMLGRAAAGARDHVPLSGAIDATRRTSS